MASRSQRIPPRFDDDFLDWFRARLEAYWAALPQRTPGEALTEYVQAGELVGVSGNPVRIG